MKLIWMIIFIFICLLGLNVAKLHLKLVNAIFRHGDRTPVLSGMYLKDPYYNSTFPPYGIGALTDSGKMRVREFGKQIQNRYKDFLSEINVPRQLYARSTDNDRTKMSLRLVLEAVFTTGNTDDASNWKLIPVVWADKKNDDLLGAAYQLSALEERKRIENEEDIRTRMSNLHDFMIQLSNFTGENIRNSRDIKSIYETLTAESYMNLRLPPWTKDFFPNGSMYDGVILEYDIMTYDDRITRALSGDFMTKMTSDMLRMMNGTSKERTKLFLYSAHEGNLVSVLRSLYVYKPHIPEYSSAVITELFEENNEYYVKILYYRGIPSEFVELKMPGCSILCPFDKYLKIIKNILK